MEIWPSGPDGFFARDAVRMFRFARDSGGAVVALEIDEGMAPVTRAKRISAP